MSSLTFKGTQSTTLSGGFVEVFHATIDGINQLAVDARDLHCFLKVGRKFAGWIKGRISEYQFAENLDFISFTQNGVKPNGGRPTREYHLTLDMAKELSMVENNEEGRKVRRYFIQCEKALYQTDSEQRKTLVAACTKLSAGSNMNISEVYTMVANHFGYEKVTQIPAPLLPEAVAYVYEELLARANKPQLFNKETLMSNQVWHYVGVIQQQRVSNDIQEALRAINDAQQAILKAKHNVPLIYDAFAESDKIPLTCAEYVEARNKAKEFVAKMDKQKMQFGYR